MARTSKHSSPDSKDYSKPGGSRPGTGRPMWSGSISFGLVSIPVKLYSGIRPKDIRLHLLHEKDKSRIQERLFCPVEQQEIPREETVKGYELNKEQHVVVTQEEINSLEPKATRTIELLSVVDLAQIDPIYFNKPFFLVPEEQSAKAYFVFLEALRETKKGAVGKFVMRNKEYIGAIRPIKKVLCLDTLHYADEMVNIDDLELPGAEPKVREAEVKMARQLLESLEADFEPEKLHDHYRDALLRLIHRKAEGEEIVTQPPQEEEAPHVIDLMEALKKSVAQVQRHKGRHAA